MRLPPAVRFADDAHRARTIADAERARAIVLLPRCSGPGQLKGAIDADFESVLASRGAMPCAVRSDAPYRAVVEDQLARAAMLPVRGVCISMPVLADLCEANDSLNEDDLRTLSVWVEAAKVQRRLRVVVLLSEIDRDTTLLVPRRLEDHLAPNRLEHETVTSHNSFADTPRAPAVEEREVAAVEPPSEPVAPAVVSAVAVSEALAEANEVARVAVVVEPEAAVVEVEVVLPVVLSARSGDTLRPPSLPDLDLGEALAQALSGSEDDAEEEGPSSIEAATAYASSAPVASEESEPDTASEPEVEASAPVVHAVKAVPAAAPSTPDFRKAMKRVLADEPADEVMISRVQQTATFRGYAMDLDAAKGPKPVAIVERLFAQRYVPLLAAAHRGELDGAALAVAEEWRASFAESYENAYAGMRATGKRPTMVMDAPDVATRVARLSSARSIKLIMVDSMSYDLGDRVQARVGRALDKRAVLVETTTLWSALPTRTFAQMHLLAKGPEGLKDPVSGPPSEPDVTRGRAVSTLRREKVGSRELLKLDLVEARLRAQGAAYDERLDALADEIAEVLVKFMETQPPRTLVYIFGDHGFVLGAGSNGWATGAATQGGASPEEVLVGGYGFLVDAVQ
jgi:hypothetical protein